MRLKLILLFTIFLFNSAKSQEISALQSFQSPTAASLGEYAAIPVGYYTGIPGINIPLHQVSSKNLNVPISLSYHAGGLKVNEIAGWVGLGWSLNSGGVITRTVNGIPDDRTHGYINISDDFTGSNWPTPGTTLKDDFANERVDPSPDEFFFNFGGHSGKFMIDHEKVIIIPQTPIKIEHFGASAGEITSFIITDEKGDKYTFEDREYTTNVDINIGTSTYGQFVSSWYLSKIEYAGGDEEINFEYTLPQTSLHTYSFIHEKVIPINLCEPGYETRTFDIKSSTENIYLKSITSNTDKVEFIISDRDDAVSSTGAKQEKKLETIKLLKNGVYFKEWGFTYDYYNSTGDAYDEKRLRLISVKEKVSGSSIEKPSYKFSYNSNSLPSRFSDGVDHWGFYNGKEQSNINLIPKIPGLHPEGANREPDITKTRIGLLEEITYPTGGSTLFEFESNSYSWIRSQEINGLDFYVDEDESVTSSTSTLATASFTIDYVQHVKLATEFSEIGNPTGMTAFEIPFVEILDNSSNEIIRVESEEAETKDYYVTLQSGTYSIRSRGYTSSQGNYIESFGRVFYTDTDTYTISEFNGGGVRVKEMEVNTGTGLTSDTITKTYDYTSNNVSTGVMLRDLRYYSTNEEIPVQECYFGTISSSSKIPLASTQGSFVTYSKVKEKIDGAGYTEYQYQKANLALDLDISSTLWENQSFLSNDWKRGHLKKRATFDEQGDTLQVLDIFYEPIQVENINAFNTRVYSWDFWVQSLGVVVYYEEKEVLIRSYQPQSSWFWKNKEVKKNYEGAGSNPVTIITEYERNSVNGLPSKITTTNSLTSEKRVRSHTYAYEQDFDPDYSEMESLNMLTQPYSVLVEDGSGVDLSKSWTTWDEWATDQWLPKEQWVWDGSGDPSDPPVNTGVNKNAIKISEVLEYDGNGNPLEIQDAQGTKTSYDWSADKTVPTGIFKNADYDEVLAHSFAYDGIEGWVPNDYNDDNDTQFTIVDNKLRLRSLIAATNAEKDNISYTFGSEITQKLVWEFDVKIANSTSWDLQINAGGSSWDYKTKGSGYETVVWSAINNEDWKVHDGSQWLSTPINDTKLIVGEIYNFKIVIDPTEEEIDFYINGRLLKSAVDFAFPSSGVQKFTFGNYGYSSVQADWHIDNVRIYPERAQAQSQEIDPLFNNPLAIKDVSGSTNRFEFDDFGRLYKSYSSEGELISTNNYYYSALGNSGSYEPTDPNYVETISNDPNGVVKSISYLDGLGREIQTQIRGGDKVIATETLYNDRGLPEVVSRPIEEDASSFPGYYDDGLLSGGSTFTPGDTIPTIAPVASHYSTFHSGIDDDDELYAYSYTQYEDSPLARVEKSTLPGEDHQTVVTQAVTTSYGLNTTETFETSAQGTTPAKMWVANTLNKTISKNPDGNQTITYTNGWGQTIASGVDMNSDDKLSRTTGDDLVTEFAYDIRGNLVRVEDPLGFATTYSYNTLGQLISKKLPDQDHSNKYCYDDKGRLRFHADPNDLGDPYNYSGTDHYSFTYTKYDEFDRPVEVGLQDASYVSQASESSFELICASSTQLNDQNEPNANTIPQVIYSYDGTNKATLAQNLKGRLTRTQYKDSNTGQWGYTWYSYNSLGLIEFVIQRHPGQSYYDDRTISYTYDELGRITKVSYDEGYSSTNDHFFWYYYDELGRLEKVTSYGTDASGSALTEAEYTYYADGQVKQLKLGGGAQTVDYDYTIQGWLEDINDGAASGSDQFGMFLDYTNSGNISQQQWSQAAFSTGTYNYFYNYDPANRLSEACFGSTNDCSTMGDYDVTYDYDDNGNIRLINRNGAGNEPDYEYDVTLESETNKVDSIYVDGISGETEAVLKQYDHDANGNMIKNEVQGIATVGTGITSVTYDWRNLPTSLSANGSTITYAYDSDGNRIKKSIGSTTTWYVRGADGQTIATYQGSTLLYLNILAGGQVIGQIQN